MMSIRQYEDIVGRAYVDTICQKAEQFSEKHILCINSTWQGGGVAEMLNSIVPLFNNIGIPLGWRILHGNPDFFKITKKFHNALQGEAINLSKMKKKMYHETNRRFSIFTHIDHDLVIVHDPQPLPLIKFYEKKQPWIFRCHIDILNPNHTVWNYLKPFVECYDHIVVSGEDFKQSINVPQTVIYPAIDPLTVKNRKITEKTIDRYLRKFKIERERPIIVQVSRFDKWKDPLGVIKIFELVRKKEECTLVLIGSFASDDPEGQRIFENAKKKVERSPYKNDIKLILNGPDIMVNCLQRAAAVVIQKSLKEGFGLTVTEALYKGTPVVASNIGGIPLQVIDGMNGFLHEPTDYESFSKSVITLLRDKQLRDTLGNRGREHVIRNFLITRLILDWLTLFEKVFGITTDRSAGM
jgi:trehalose synthase